jgi:hypothetical protein
MAWLMDLDLAAIWIPSGEVKRVFQAVYIVTWIYITKSISLFWYLLFVF